MTTTSDPPARKPADVLAMPTGEWREARLAMLRRITTEEVRRQQAADLARALARHPPPGGGPKPAA